MTSTTIAGLQAILSPGTIFLRRLWLVACADPATPTAGTAARDSGEIGVAARFDQFVSA